MTQNNLTEEYQQYITANENKTFNNFITENNHTDVFNNFVTVNQTTLQQTFVNNTTMGDVYNNYYQTNVVNQFLTQNNLTEQYQQYVTVNQNKTFNDFITENNHTDVFNNYVTQNNITYQTIAQQVINQYQLQTTYQQWIDNRVTNLTQNIYIQLMTPKAVRPVPLPQWEDFWINLFSNSLPADATGLDLIIQQIALPDTIMFSNTDSFHLSYTLSDPLNPLTVLPYLLMHGRFAKIDITNPSGTLVPVASPIKISIGVSNGDNVKNIRLPISGNERLLCGGYSSLRFEWESALQALAAISITLIAKKRKIIPSDSSTIKLSGWFKIKDSIKGNVLDAAPTGDLYGQRGVFGVSSFGIISDELITSTAPDSQWFYDDFSVVATGYNGDLQNATVHIKNMSKQARTLTFTPVNFAGMGYSYKSSIDNTEFNLPANARLENGSIFIDLAASEDV